MRRHLLKVVFASLTLVHAAAGASAQVADVRAFLPGTGSVITVRATLPVPNQTFDRLHCPYKLVAPSGMPLATQWELVARLQDHMVVELLAPYVVAQPGWNDFDVVLGNNNVNFSRYQSSALQLALTHNDLQLVIEDQSGGLTTKTLSGLGGWEFERLGLGRITGKRHVKTEFGNWHVWITLDAFREQIGVVLNMHNSSLPAAPNRYFRSVRLNLPQGWSWTSEMPDPVSANGYLITPGQHVLPQRMERPFRLVVHPTGVTPHVAEQGWGIGDWTGGGLMPQNVAVPVLPNANIDLVPDMLDAYQRLSNFQATSPGEQPVSPLWPAKGVLYGGMTGGIDITQLAGVELAMTGQPAGLLYQLVDQLRYGARHRAAIYDADGEVIELEDFLSGNGSHPWVMFNSGFLGNPPADVPFGFSQTGPGIGFSNYDPTIFDAVDTQHLVRRMNANRVLGWLANDPLAKHYIRGDAEISRMTFFEGPGGRLDYPSTAQGMGGTWGRGEAWACEALLQAYAMGDDRFRQRTGFWFQKYVDILSYMQMPNGMFSATETGKIAETPPYGDGTNAFFAAHRSNEQIQLAHALRGIRETIGLPVDNLLRELGDGLWRFAWKAGTGGVLDRYPASPVGANYRWHSSWQFPAGLTNSVPPDGYHVGTALGYAIEVGSTGALQAAMAHTGTQTLHQARLVLEGYGAENLANRAPLVRAAQDYFP
ncbi:MAG: hypothetical protein WD226_03020 [Planctomycetota bacterium]